MTKLEAPPQFTQSPIKVEQLPGNRWRASVQSSEPIQPVEAASRAVAITQLTARIVEAAQKGGLPEATGW